MSSIHDRIPFPSTKGLPSDLRRSRLLAARGYGKKTIPRRAILLGHWDHGSVVRRHMENPDETLEEARKLARKSAPQPPKNYPDPFRPARNTEAVEVRVERQEGQAPTEETSLLSVGGQNMLNEHVELVELEVRKDDPKPSFFSLFSTEFAPAFWRGIKIGFLAVLVFAMAWYALAFLGIDVGG